MRLESSVLIVGGGPCGLMLAIELGRRGVHATLVDAKPGTAFNPQANATQARTMEHFRRLGFADAVRAEGLPRNYPTDIAYFTRYGDRELARFRLPTSERAADARGASGSWSAAELPHRISQKFVERILREQASSHSSVSLNYGWRLNALEERADGVLGQIQNVGSGDKREVFCQYLVGVDGARSLVRRHLGIRYTGETGVQRDFFGGRMLSVYLRAPEFYDNVPHDPAWMYWAFNPQRRSWLAAINGRDEFAFHTQLKPGEDDGISETWARELFAQAMGIPCPIEILDVRPWIAGHALVAESFGRGRVLIGGDAAHLFTPAGGLGYNTAVEDAVNLAWKLAAALDGSGGPHLLPSYEYERRKLAIRNTNYAKELAASIGNFIPVEDLEAEGAEGDAARAAAGAHLNAHARREFNIPGITFGGRYDGSPIISGDGSPVPEDAANRYTPTAVPGGRPPHLWLDGGISLFDRFGADWTLLNFAPQAQLVSLFEGHAQLRRMKLRIVHLPLGAARELYGADLVLIRPDHIVAWRGGGEHVQVADVLSRSMGRGAEPSNTQQRTAGA